MKKKNDTKNLLLLLTLYKASRNILLLQKIRVSVDLKVMSFIVAKSLSPSIPLKFKDLIRNQSLLSA